MFQKFNDLKKAQALQRAMTSETIKVEDHGITVVMNGNMKIEEINLNPQLNIEEQNDILKDLLNNTFLTMQKKLALKLFSKESQ